MKKIIGKRDKADFPELMLTDIELKVDTGAYTSSIHCHHIEEVEIEGVKYVKFLLLDPSHPEYNEKEFKTKNYKEKLVKSSNGVAESRYIVTTIIHIFGEDYPIELSLSERSEMKYPILIGRKLLNGNFIVDTSKNNLSYKLKIRQ